MPSWRKCTGTPRELKPSGNRGNQVQFCIVHLPLNGSDGRKAGAHNRLNTRKEYALTAVKVWAMVPHFLSVLGHFRETEEDSEVPTTFSLATSPVMAATAACQLPQPRREDPGNSLPIRQKPVGQVLHHPKTSVHKPETGCEPDENGGEQDHGPTFLIKDQPRSHMLRSSLTTVGIW